MSPDKAEAQPRAGTVTLQPQSSSCNLQRPERASNLALLSRFPLGHRGQQPGFKSSSRHSQEPLVLTFCED